MNNILEIQFVHLYVIRGKKKIWSGSDCRRPHPIYIFIKMNMQKIERLLHGLRFHTNGNL